MKDEKFWGRFLFIPVIIISVSILSILYNGLYRLGFFETNFKQLDAALIIHDEACIENTVQKSLMPEVSQTGSGNIDINNASREELDALPGIGKVKAEAIIEQRAKMGGFSTLKDLVCTEGIGPNTFKRIEPYLRISEYKGND